MRKSRVWRTLLEDDLENMYQTLRLTFFACVLGNAFSTGATVLLDDTWADGTRSNQNLPAESAWFSSSGAALTAAPNSMSLALGSTAVMGITYFTTNDIMPAQLGVGDTLTASFRLSF